MQTKNNGKPVKLRKESSPMVISSYLTWVAENYMTTFNHFFFSFNKRILNKLPYYVSKVLDEFIMFLDF